MDEVRRELFPYLVRHVVYDRLYRLGLLRYCGARASRDPTDAVDDASARRGASREDGIRRMAVSWRGVDLSLIIPAYNEVRRIGDTLASTRACLDALARPYEIIVAADGDDGTRDVVSDLARHDARLFVLGGPGRGGKGRGVRDGVARARGGIIGFMDADYKTPIEELPRLLAWLDQGYDVVIGSRVGPGARIEVPQPLHRRLGAHAFGLAMHLCVGLWDIRDTQCGFKVFRGPVAKTLFGRQRVDGYMFDVEILYLARRSGYRIKPVGVRWRDDGDSRLDLVAGNWRNMIDLLRIRFGRPGPPLAPAREADELSQ